MTLSLDNTIAEVCKAATLPERDHYVDSPAELWKRYQTLFRKKLHDAGFVPREEIARQVDTVINYTSQAAIHKHYAEYLYERARHVESEPVAAWRPPRYSVLLCGSCGTGKTMLAQTLARPVKTPHGNRFGFVYRTASEIVEAYSEQGIAYVQDIKGDWRWQHVFVDELGSETDGMHYGVKWGMREFLLWRYECWKSKYAATTLLTTNLSGIDELAAYYGDDERLKSRLTEMCVVISLRCSDWRLEHPAGRPKLTDTQAKP